MDWIISEIRMTMRNTVEGYLIPCTPLRDSLIVVNSRFITTIRRVDSVAAAREQLASVRAELADASHHVYAFRIGFGNSVTEGMSDDGEPTGTAGPPILAVLRGTEIGDILVVVSRYFGGTKLGTGGLVRAYSEAARRGLARLETERKVEWNALGIEISYSLYEQVKLLIEHNDGVITGTEFAGKVTVYARFPRSSISKFRVGLRELSAGRSEALLLD